MCDVIQGADMFFLATADAQGRPDCSYKGGDPGFVTVVDERTLAWPNFDVNDMYLSMGNIAANPRVGLLFIDFQDPDRIRVNGEASIHHEDPLLERFPEAPFMVRVAVREVFPNPSSARASFPVKGARRPGWKRAPWAKDHLPANDPARSA